MAGWLAKGGVDGVTRAPTPKQLGITIVTFKRLKRGSSSSSGSGKAKTKPTHTLPTTPCPVPHAPCPSTHITPKPPINGSTHTRNSHSNPRGKATSSERCESRVLCSVCGPLGAPRVLAAGCCVNLYVYTKSIYTMEEYVCGTFGALHTWWYWCCLK